MVTKGIASLASLAILLLLTLAIHAETMMLRERISQSLEELLASQGIENCENKCEKSFNRLAYQVATRSNQNTFEFQACVRGCNHCSTNLANSSSPDSDCFTYCKNFDWKSLGLIKGVIEPDKACIGGCVVNTCQVICTGGTTESRITPKNKQFFYPNGGCSIKTQPYSQYLQYVPWNSPNTGQGGSQDAASCCSNALSLCQYFGDTNSANYQNLVFKTQRFCSSFVPSRTVPDICDWFENQQNCGTVNVAIPS